MLNTFRMYVYRMMKSRLTYGILIAAFLMCALIFFTDTFVPMMSLSKALGIESAVEQNGFDMLRSMFAVGFHTVILTIFPIMFFAVDYSTGYVKNLVGYRTDKVKLCGANLLLTVVYVLAGYIINLLFGSIIILIFCKNVAWQGAGKFLLYILVNIIETVCYAQIMLFLADFMKKNIGAMIICMVYGFLSSIIYLLVDLIAANNVDNAFLTETSDYSVNVTVNPEVAREFLIERYTILGGASVLNRESAYGDFLRMGLIALGVLILFFFLDVLALNKRDVG